MYRRSSLLFSAVMCSILLTVTACGGGGSSGAPKITPTPGGVVAPTEANAYMWLPRSTVKEKNGDILIADSGNWDRTDAKVVELNPQGQPVWVYKGGLDFPHSAYPMANGDILISDTGNDRVIEVNRAGKIVWNTDNLGGGGGYLGMGKLSNGVHLLYPNDAYPMANGDILISSRYTNAVYEINKSGQVQWSCAKFMVRQHNPRLLPNGNLIVADSDNGRGIIINHSCTKIVFSYGPRTQAGNIAWPRTFQPDAGNYVIGDSQGQRILEINSNKQIQQEWDSLPSPFYVTVLKNGNLLTQDSNIHGAVVLGKNGGIFKQYSTSIPDTNPTSLVNPSFEATGPPSWKQGDLLTETLPAGVRADMKFDTSQAHSGKSSGMISWPTNTGHLNLFWFQTMKVTAGKTYNFSGWIKTDKVLPCAGCSKGVGTPNGGDALFSIQALDPTNPLNPQFLPPPSDNLGNSSESGTQNWTQLTTSFTVPSGVTDILVECILQGRGTAWFDDVTVH